ncbi:hypothetical protein B0H11DRAFT_2228383 [Mycena galericulata]|nr:hypothetical protein B0H11DRAFT_2228383 [Mycena galericulata]
MESEANPLNISELVDHAISFLISPDDFRACALVSRSWVHSSQSRLFSKIEIDERLPFPTGANTRFCRLLAIMEESPRLAGFISNLTIHMNVIEASYLPRLSLLPYRLLMALHIGCSIMQHLGLEESLAIQKLLSVPSLISVTVLGTFKQQRDFLRIWEGCSENIKHLSHWNPISEQVAQEFVGPVFGVPKKHIKLESLHGFSSHKSNRWWLEDANCPFDISCLKAFGDSLRNDAHGDIPATAYATIEIISTNLYSKQPYDLSGFQRLAQVKITTDGLEVSSDLEMIRTILPQNRSRLEAIQVHITHSSDTIKAFIDLDSEISTLQSDFYNLKIVEITTKMETPTLTKGVEEYFPLLNQTTSLRWNFRPGTEAPWYTRIVQPRYISVA